MGLHDERAHADREGQEDQVTVGESPGEEQEAQERQEERMRLPGLEEPVRLEVWIVPFDIHVGCQEGNIDFLPGVSTCGCCLRADGAETAIGKALARKIRKVRPSEC